MLTSSVRLLVLVLASAWAEARSPECSEAVLSTGGRSLMAEVDTVLTVESADSRSVECHHANIFTFATNIFPLASPDCEVRLRLLAVGGGGDGDAFSGNAGGSGQVVFTEVGLEKFKIGLVRASCTCWI